MILTMKLAQKSALLLILSFCLLGAQAQEQDPFCVLFNSYDQCTMCTLGKVPLNNKCVDAIPHCLEFSRAYKCTVCEVGYSITAEGNCLAKAASYYEMNSDEIRVDQYFGRIQTALIPIKIKYPGNTDLFKVYKFSDAQVNAYRAIYRNPSSFYQVLAKISRIDNRVTVQTILEVVPTSNDKSIVLKNDPLFSRLQQQFILVYPTIQLESALSSYLRQNGDIQTYRIVLITLQKGLVEIVLSILPKFKNTEIESQSINLLRTDEKFSKSLTYFLNKYEELFKGGSADKIGRIVRNGQTYYFIYFTTKNGIYQVQYVLDKNLKVSYEEISRTENVPVFGNFQTTNPLNTNFGQNKNNGGFEGFGFDNSNNDVFEFGGQTASSSSSSSSSFSSPVKNTTTQNSSTITTVTQTSTTTTTATTTTTKDATNATTGTKNTTVTATAVQPAKTTTSAQTTTQLNNVIRDNHQYLNGLDLIGSEQTSSQHYVFIYGFGDTGDNSQKWRYDVTLLSNGEADIVETRTEPVLKDSQRQLTPDEYQGDYKVVRVIQETLRKNSLTLSKDLEISSVKEIIRSGQITYQIILAKKTYTRLTFISSLNLSNGDVTVLSSSQKVIEIAAPHSFSQLQISLYPPVVAMKKLLEEIYPQVTVRNGILSKVTLEKSNLTAATQVQTVYKFTYLQGDGTEYIYSINLLANGGFNIVSTEKIVPKPKSEPFQIVIASLGGTLLNASEISQDSSFKIIDKEIKSKNSSLTLTQSKGVYRLKKSTNIYYQIFYPLANGLGGWLYNVAISAVDSTKYQIQKSEYFSNIEANLTKQQILADTKLTEIDNFFKVIYLNKLGFTAQAKIIEASKRVADGVINYQIKYLLKDQKSTLTFSVQVVFNGKIQVKGVSEGVRQDLYDTQPKIISPIEYSNDIFLIQVQNYLQNIEKALQEDQIRQVSRQRTPEGNHYWITYQNSIGDGYNFTVFRSIQGKIEVKSIVSIGNAPQQIPVIPLRQVPVNEALRDFNFQKADKEIRRSIFLQGYSVVEVSIEQKKNGYTYKIQYKNQNTQDIYNIEAFLDLNDKVEITSSKFEKVQSQNTSSSTTSIPGATTTTTTTVQTNPAPPQIDVIYLTAEQLRSDPTLLRIDTFLRSSNTFLGGYTIYSVGVLADLTSNSQTYTIIYQNGQSTAIMFKVLVEGPTSLRIIETQKLQLTSSLNSSSMPPSVILLKSADETYLPFASFQISQPQLAYYFLSILSAFSIQASDIQYILFSHSADTYKLITINNMVYWMSKSKYDGTYTFKKIEDIGHRLLNGQSSDLSQQQYPSIANAMRLNITITTVTGVYYVSYQNYIRYYHLTVTDSTQQKYKVVLIVANTFTSTSTNASQFKLISMYRDNIQNQQYSFDDEIFVNDGQLQDMIQQVTGLGIGPVGQIEQSTFKLQRAILDANILRATFRRQVADGTNALGSRIEVIYHRQQQIFLSFQLMDGGLVELRNYQMLGLELEGVIQGGYIAELTDVDRLLRQQWGNYYLRLADISYAMGQKIGGSYIFYLVYRTQEESLAFTILRASASKIVITGYDKLDSSSESPRYIYGTLENVEPVKITQAKKSKAFQVAEKTLFDGYSHYLLGAVIKEILIDDTTVPNKINYNVVYQTGGGLFLAVLDYLKDTMRGEIRALVLIGATGLARKAADCDILKRNNPIKCQVCEKGFHLETNELCYQQVPYCRVHAGSQCIACEGPFYLKENRCTSNCLAGTCIY